MMTDARYLQVCVEASDGADGPGLARFLKEVLTSVGASWAVLSDIDLVGTARADLATEPGELRVLPVLRLLRLLESAEQVVWATICLCRSRESAQTISATEDFASALTKAEALVRVVDGGYYYVYGALPQTEELGRTLGGEHKQGLASELEFPE